MTDYFALLDEPRRPWLDPEPLKTRFLERSSEVHPDRIHNAPEAEKQRATQQYAELTAAHNILREPRDRLLHLLELESGGKPKDVQRIPPGTMDLFVEVGQLCQNVDRFLGERAKVTSPLLKVQMFERGMEWTEQLQALLQRINSKRQELTEEVQQMNVAWAGAPAIGSTARAAALPLERLEQIYRSFSYIARWTEQINERLVQLAV